MFNSTHSLVGAAIARTGLDRWAPGALWTAVIAANLPDIDIIAELGNTATYLEHHRGLSHSIAGIPVLALLLALLMARISGGSFVRHFVIALLAMATHPLLDLANNYGMRPFLPFSGTWYYGDVLFIIDPYLDLVLLAGVVVGWKWPERRIAGAVISIALALAYIGGRVELRNAAEAQLARYDATVTGLLHSAVSPQMMNPFVWTGFVESRDDVANVSLDLRSGVTHEVFRMAQDPPSAITAAAEATQSGSIFRGFARFPVTRVEATPTGYRVLLIDFRFVREAAHTSLAAEILLDPGLHVERESLNFTQSIAPLGSE